MATVFSGLFGCGRQYAAEDIVGISLWESGMDRNASYSFGLIRQDGIWYLSAECGSTGKRERFDCMYLPVKADAILDAVRESGLIRKTRSAGKLRGVFAPDAPRRGVVLTFSDHAQQSAEIAAPALLDAFRQLAAALENEIPVYSVQDTTGLYLSADTTDADGAYSFELFRRDAAWYFSASCRSATSGGAAILLEEISVEAAEADALLAAAFEEELAQKVFTYRTLPDGIETLDADIHRISMRFGTESGTAELRSEKLEEMFFALAEKYAEIYPDEEG